MTRVIVSKFRNHESIIEGASVCPVGCFHKKDSEYVIDPNDCIDCGSCQTVTPENAIVTDDEAEQSDIDYNAKYATEWEPAI